MSDPYIDQFETLSYGPFAVRQIRTLVMGMDPNFDPLLQHLITRLDTMNNAMSQALNRSGGLETATYKAVESGPDPVTEARDVIERLASYLKSRKNGEQLLGQWFGRQTVSAVSRRRPAKLLGTLKQAETLLDEPTAVLPEAATWKTEVTQVHTALEALDQRVRGARVARREMTPEVRETRGGWLLVYAALKLVVEAVLRLHQRLELMPEVFDDLAEIHRAPGVSDEPPQGEPSTPPTTPATPPTSLATAPTSSSAGTAAAPAPSAAAPPPATTPPETSTAAPPAPAAAAATPSAPSAQPSQSSSPERKPKQGSAKASASPKSTK